MGSVVIIGGNAIAIELIKIYEKKKKRVYFLTRKKKKNIKLQKIIKYNYKNIIKFLDKKKPRIIINLVTSLSNDPINAFNVNVYLPFKLLEWTKKNGRARLVLVGSSAEYGYHKKNILSENSVLKPKSIYGISKVLQSYIANQYFKLFNTNFILLRLFNLKGKVLNRKLLIGKINHFIQKNLNKKATLNLGNLSNYRDYIDVKKVAEYIFQLEKKSPKGEIINIGSGKPIMIRNLVNEIFDKHTNLNYKENKSKKNFFDPVKIYANINKLNKIISNGKN